MEAKQQLETGEQPGKTCATCTEGDGTPNECPKSRRECGHHCDCSYEQSKCCYCGATFGDLCG